MNTERRKTNRAMSKYEVFATSGGSSFACQSRDVSLYGIGLVADRALPPGAPVEMSIYVKDANLNFQVKGLTRHCTAARGKGPAPYVLGIEFTEGHEQGLPFIESATRPSDHALNQSMIVAAPADVCYRLLTNIERFPDWNPEIKVAKVHERYPDGRCKRVEFEHDFIVLKVHYIDEYTYDDANRRLSWRAVGGDKLVINNLGGYVLQPIGADKTSITFAATITISLIPSKRLVNYFSTIGVRKALKNLKNLIEKENPRT